MGEQSIKILHQVQSPFVYLTLPHITRRDDTSLVFTLHICILEATKYCRGEGLACWSNSQTKQSQPGNEISLGMRSRHV